MMDHIATTRLVTAGRKPAIRLLAAALLLLMTPAPGLLAQVASSNVVVSAPLLLHINIIEGEDALNNIRERTAREPIVQVEDSNHKPVAGVAVVFTSLRGPNGAGGTFNSFTSYKTVTNAEGKAVGRGFQPNTTAGQYTIQVQAASGSMVTGVVIHETNTLTGGGVSSSSSTSNVGSQSASQTTTGASQTASAAGTAGHLIHLINLIPKWVVVGVVAGGVSATAIAVTVTNNNSGAVISTGGGTVTAPAVAKPAGRR